MDEFVEKYNATLLENARLDVKLKEFEESDSKTVRWIIIAFLMGIFVGTMIGSSFPNILK